MSFIAIEEIEFQGQPARRLRLANGAQATVLLYGGHVVSWITPDGRERLYLSDKASYVAGQAIRGGVPVIFPQFSTRGPLPRHGFARTLPWQLVDARGDGDFAIANLRLEDSEATRALWPQAFVLELSVAISGQRLDLELEVRNTGDTSFSFAAALHTYLRVREVEETTLEGLRGQRYTDSLAGQERRDSGVTLSVDDEIDRIYHDTDHPLLLREARGALGIHAENMPDTVVWNPWESACAKIADMPPQGFRHMLCVEAAVIEEPVVLEPGADWWGRQTLLAM